MVYCAIAFQVRGWAIKSVRGLGLINPDDYYILTDVIRWMIGVVEINLFDNSDILTTENRDPALPLEILPKHLFLALTRGEYWLGLFVLVRHMDVSTIQSYFMTSTGHIEFLQTILSSMKSLVEGIFIVIHVFDMVEFVTRMWLILMYFVWCLCF